MRKQTRRADPLDRAIDIAFQPGRYINYNEGYAFVIGLREVAKGIDQLVAAEPARAAALYETFIARCTEKAEEIDDSDGSMAMFVSDIYAGWIKIRQAWGADPAETAQRLLAWIDADEYGFTNDLEVMAPEVLDKAGREAFEQAVLARLAPASSQRKRDRNLDWDRRRWERALRAVYQAQGDVPKYVDLSEKTGASRDDCIAIASMLQAKRKFEEALGWVERGMDIKQKGDWAEREGHRLPGIRRELLAKLGRGAEALDAAWVEFQASPSLLAYNELLKYVPKTERPAWRGKALAVSENGKLHQVVEMWLDLNEIDRLAARLERATDIELERQSHYTTEPAAERLAKTHPAIAARVFRALCVRILDVGKSKYYQEALTNLGKAMDCYRKAGLDSQWESLVSEIRRDHWRKTAFMPGFKAIVSGRRVVRMLQ